MKPVSLKSISETIKPILMRYGVKYAGIFGSYARGEEKPSSDIDILVNFDNPISLVELFDMKENISQKLEKDVDIVSEKSIIPYFKDNILKDLKIIYGER